MRAILEAEILSLEQAAGQLKGWSELTQRIAEDKKCEPEDPEKFPAEGHGTQTARYCGPHGRKYSKSRAR
jgi:hypothetical protein